MKKIFYVLFTALIFGMFTSYANADYGEEISKRCMYTGNGEYTDSMSYYLEIYNDGTYSLHYKLNTGILGRTITNWSDNSVYVNKEGDNAKEYFSKYNECPNYLYLVEKGLGYPNYLSNLDMSDVGIDGRIISQEKLVKEYDNIIKVCDYETFFVDFDENGNCLGATAVTNARTVYKVLDTLKLSSSGTCPDLYGCESSYDPIEITLFKDEIEYERKKDICTNFLGNFPTPDKYGDFGNNCSTYYEYKNNLITLWESCKNNSDCSEYNKLKNEISSLCQGITQYANYGESGCLNHCLNLKNDLAIIENQKDTTSLEQCGFSDNLLGFIRNIMKWVKYLIPAIIIILSILDFIKAIGSDKEDEMKKAQHKLVIRLIVAVLIFIIPFIIEFILDKMGFVAEECGIIDF